MHRTTFRIYPGMAYYFPEIFGTVATQIGSCAEHYNSVFSFEYFDRLVKQTGAPPHPPHFPPLPTFPLASRMHNASIKWQDIPINPSTHQRITPSSSNRFPLQLFTLSSPHSLPRDNKLHQPSVEKWGTAKEGCLKRAMPPTFGWGIIGYASKTQRIVRLITTEYGE